MFARWAQQLRNRGRRVSADIRTALQPPVAPAQQAQGAAPDPAPAQDADQEQNSDSGTETDNEARKEAATKYDRDMRLQEKARRRWNAAIKPRSNKFQKTLTMFREKLKGSSIQAVLDQFFTRHEQDLLIPADKRRNPALAWIQRNNRDRYRRLVRSPRFAIVQEHEATIELKLTMLYFGLPVSCIQFNPADEFDCDTDTADDEAEAETEKRREEAAKKQNKLRWLNAYGNRHLGRDNLRKADPAYEVYYTFNSLYQRAAPKKVPAYRRNTAPISLRGGGSSEDLLDMKFGDPMHFNESEVHVESMAKADSSDHHQDGRDQVSPEDHGISLRGGGWDDDNFDPFAHDVTVLNYDDPPYEPPARSEQTPPSAGDTPQPVDDDWFNNIDGLKDGERYLYYIDRPHKPSAPESAKDPQADDVSTITDPLMRTAEAVSTSLYKPKEKKPSVSFEIDTIHEENEARREKEEEREEARKAEIRKGKQPAHASPESRTTQPGILFGKRPTEVPAPAKNSLWKRPDTTPQPPTQHEREREAREGAYAKPPSIHTHNMIPSNAPPVEKLLQFGTDNVPITSLGVLTPTEQRKLQVEYYHMRNILLDRSQKCPYRGCDRVIAIGDDDRMQKHLRDAHMGDGCNFCDEVLYEHWTINQRRAHFLKCHSDLFLRKPHVQDDNSFRAHNRPHGRVDYDRESRWSYCPRCGRDHTALTAKADREHHDSVCYPGAPKGDWVVCTKCGVFHSKTEYHRQCRKNINTLEYPYCNTCGLGQGLFSDLYHGTHQLHCKPIRNDDPKYCPWCGIELLGSLDQRRFHHDNCEYCPDAPAEGPIDGETGQIWPPKPPIEEQEPEPEQEPPEMCTLCKKSIIGFDAHLIQKHIDDEHGDYSSRCCIFCKLNYETRGWADERQQILLHLDDHIHDRKEKMAADLVVTLGKLPWNHPFKMKPLRPTDYAAVRDMREAQETKEIYGNLWESTRKLIDEMNEDKRTITELRKELQAAKEKLGESEQVSQPPPAPAPRTLPPNPFGPKQTTAPADAPVTPAGPVTGSTLALGPPATEQTAAHRARFNPFAPKQTAAPPPAQGTPAGPATGSVFVPTPPTTNQKKDTDKGKGKEKEVTKPPVMKVTQSRPSTSVEPLHLEPRPTSAAARKKKPPRPSSSNAAAAAADPNFKPSGSDSSEEDNEFRARRQASIAKRKRTWATGRDPSYRPPRDDDDDEEEEEEDEFQRESSARRKRRGAAQGSAAAGGSRNESSKT